MNNYDAPQPLPAPEADAPPAILDKIIAPSFDSEPDSDPDAPQMLDEDGNPPQQDTPEPSPEDLADMQRGREKFFQLVFRPMFGIPAMIDAEYAPVSISDPEVPAAREASDALYDVAKEYFPDMIDPTRPEARLLICTAPFVGTKIYLALMIKRSLDAKTVEDTKRAPDTANQAQPMGDSSAMPFDEMRVGE